MALAFPASPPIPRFPGRWQALAVPLRGFSTIIDAARYNHCALKKPFSGSGILRASLRCLGVAAAYAGTGKLGLLLAIPPGYATALWPPSGIALAALLIFGPRLWPGVLLGSFAVNLSISYDATGGWATHRSILLAFTIAGGAALQALAGAALVRRFVGFPLELLRERETVKFLFLAGPLSCLVNATISVAALLLIGAVQARDFAYSWWTWWLGDAIGIAVVAPLVLIALAEPREVWRRRATTIALPLAATLSVICAFFVWVSSLETRHTQSKFSDDTEDMTRSVRDGLERGLLMLQSLGGLLETVPEDNVALLSAFTRHAVPVHPGLQAISWNPVVKAGDRAAFEERARRSGYDGYRIVEADGTPSPPREEHVAVLHIEPREFHSIARGFDVSSEPGRREALRRARETGLPAATGRIHLVQESEKEYGILVFHPVYAPGMAGTSNPSPSEREPRGYATAIFRMGEFMRSALQAHSSPEIGITVEDEGSGGPPLWTNDRKPPSEAVTRGELFHSARFEVAGRTWRVSYRGTPSYWLSQATLRPWVALAGGMGFAALLGAFLLVVTGRTVIMERLGVERALEMSRANEVLQREVTERRQAQEALLGKEAELRQAQKMDAIGRLAGGVAHDFNNLLTAILGYASLLASRMDRAHPEQEEVRGILKAGERAAELTRQLLAFSRKQVLQAKLVNLNAVVRQMDGMLRRVLREDIEVKAALQPDLWPIWMDPGQLEQVIVNLVVNARDAMPRGGLLTLETRNIDEGASPSGPHVLLAVHDTGEGMSAEVRSHLFEPFFTTKEVGKGTGLGLPTVYGIVKQSGGHVTADSEVGKGSVFRLYFPRGAGVPEEARRQTPKPIPRPGHESILLVEDEASVRHLCRAVLEKQGYRVRTATNGEEALAAVTATAAPVDLVVTDLVMPKLGGFDLMKRLRHDRPGVKALFISGYSESAVFKHEQFDRDSDFLSKPFTPDSLLARVRALLDLEPVSSS